MSIMIENSMCNDITSDSFDNELNKYIISQSYKSKMIIGNLCIMNTKHFNCFHKIMYKILLGIKIEDIKE